MKKAHRLFFTIVFMVVSICSYSQWTPLVSGTSNELFEITFPNSTTGYVVDYHAFIHKTIDGGTNWTQLPARLRTDSAFNFAPSLHFTNVDTGFAAFNSDLYKTVDGGNSWTDVFPDSVVAIIDLYFLTHNTGYALAIHKINYDTVFVYRTTNAGINWSPISTIHTTSSHSYPANIQMLDASNGYVVVDGDSVYSTSNGGFSWQGKLADYGTQTFSFSTLDTGYFCGGLIGIWKTTDACQTSNALSPPYFVYSDDCFFFQKDTGFVVSGTGSGALILETKNGGISWDTSYFNSNVMGYNSICFPSRQLGFASGTGGSIVRYDFTTSLMEHNVDNSVVLFPNPTVGVFSLKFSDPNKNFNSVKIVSSIGELVYEEFIEESAVKIDLSNQSKGVYFVKTIDNDGKMYIKKIIVE